MPKCLLFLVSIAETTGMNMSMENNTLRAASPLLNNFSEACPMFYQFSPLLDKFNMPMPEQSHYDVIRALIAWSLA